MQITNSMKRVVLPLLALLSLQQAAQATPSEDIPMYAVSLVGSPYRPGGTTPQTGMDCSGFVGHVYRQAVGMVLPRDSLTISEAAEPLAEAELQPGDLVFFNTLNRPYSHVGIYLGEGRFVHASSSRSGGVMVSNLNDRYWRQRFDGAGRPVPANPIQAANASLD